MEQTSLLDEATAVDVSALPDSLWVGTSSFSSPDWVGSLYPRGSKPGQFLSHYARQLRTVEIDATWHAMPRPQMVDGWEQKVGPGFRFALKVPKSITHERELEDCADLWAQFYGVTERLGDKRGPLLLQFPHFAQGRDAQEFRTGARFIQRLERFLGELAARSQLPDELVVEVRNERWIAPPLLEVLGSRGVGLALVSYYTMPHPAKLMERLDLITAPFAYVRFLGHHKRMDQLVAEARASRGKTRDWDELLVDRVEETRSWLPVLKDVMQRTQRSYVYYNNHYAGYAPGSISILNDVWREDA